MRLKFKKLLAAALALALILGACGFVEEGYEDFGGTPELSDTPGAPEEPGEPEKSEEPGEPEDPDTVDPDTEDPGVQEPDDLPAYGESFYDLENVVLYLDAYGELPPNYITKSEARDLGWSGGSVEDYLEGAAIGGDRFGNYEGLLPAAQGREYTECDIDTLGYGSRGARRLVFSDDGLYFYTEDHYESFTEVKIVGRKVEW